MKFGPVPIEDSIGAMAVHGVQAMGIVLRKGDIVRAEHVAGLRGAGIATVVVARLEAGDVDENGAARRLAEALVGEGLRVERAFTGRANIFAEVSAC